MMEHMLTEVSQGFLEAEGGQGLDYDRAEVGSFTGWHDIHGIPCRLYQILPCPTIDINRISYTSLVTIVL
jgi:hypothetical protein